MNLTLFGYPKTGKTLLFNLLTEKHEQVSKFTAASGECHKAVVDVPDERLRQLAETQKLPAVYAKIEYVDTGAMALGEVKNSTFLDLIRRADGLLHVVRGFADPEILHPLGSIDPLRDIRSMEAELIASDFITVEKRLERLESDLKKMKSTELLEEHELMKKLKSFLETGSPLREYAFNEKEDVGARGFKFLSHKPLLHVINADENTLASCRPLTQPARNKRAVIIFAGRIEQELLELEPGEREVFQKEFGLQEYCFIRDLLIRSSYELLNLISFFTIGKDETKAWTLERGANAFIAAGKIHSDIQRGFIRAEVVHWKDYQSAGGFHQARDTGGLRLEGKEYVIHDGDVIHFRFNA